MIFSLLKRSFNNIYLFVRIHGETQDGGWWGGGMVERERKKERLEKDGIGILKTHFLGDSSKSFWERIFRDRISLNKLKKKKEKKSGK
ncbi:hypothetical protein CEXT_746211 [Caerostris extrusa]|uniref:Uncharacterized protein n=1 Tax=Caerostris extrusa TaxID=172846 RepID=A0AAV4SVM6_CAEEX|nr:hypothetical protein CEXT_746211 [Caerostris extrusa]